MRRVRETGEMSQAENGSSASAVSTDPGARRASIRPANARSPRLADVAAVPVATQGCCISVEPRCSPVGRSRDSGEVRHPGERARRPQMLVGTGIAWLWSPGWRSPTPWAPPIASWCRGPRGAAQRPESDAAGHHVPAAAVRRCRRGHRHLGLSLRCSSARNGRHGAGTAVGWPWARLLRKIRTLGGVGVGG